MDESEHELGGKTYVWTGSRWYGKRDFRTPPVDVVNRLNKLIEGQLETQDAKLTDPEDMVRLAQSAREHGQLRRSIRLLEMAMAARPGHLGAATVLCSALRQDSRPSDALACTARFATVDYQPLLTSRAAAMCDLGEWENAYRAIGRVIAMSGGRSSQEALNVRSRIKANAPELFH